MLDSWYGDLVGRYHRSLQILVYSNKTLGIYEDNDPFLTSHSILMGKFVW